MWNTHGGPPLGMSSTLVALNASENLVTLGFPLQPGLPPWSQAWVCMYAYLTEPRTGASHTASASSSSRSLPLPHTPTLWFTFQEQAAPCFQSLSPRTLDFSHIPHLRTNLVRSAFRYSQNLTPSPQPPPWTKPAPFSPRLVPSMASGLPPASSAPLQDEAAREISLQHEAGCGPPPSKFSQDHMRKSQDPWSGQQGHFLLQPTSRLPHFISCNPPSLSLLQVLWASRTC